MFFFLFGLWKILYFCSHCYVTYKNAEEATSAMEKLNGYNLNGRPINVENAKPKGAGKIKTQHLPSTNCIKVINLSRETTQTTLEDLFIHAVYIDLMLRKDGKSTG